MGFSEATLGSSSAPPAIAGDVVLSVRDVSKKFCKHLRRSMAYGIVDLTKNFVGMRPDSSRLRKEEFWALRDISFELKRGEILGLIGANGSGKTTLLRLIAGIFPPDKGEIAVRGRVGALIALGAGFHPHMTGRENIYLNGAILGMSRKEIDAKLDEIIEFAEIGDFIGAPVSTYSSGMRVRLGFAIAIHTRPSIMLVDEVLSVGDVGFRLKCHRYMREHILGGLSVIFVSHNMHPIYAFCDRAMVLHQGQIIIGPTDPEEAIECVQTVYARKRFARVPIAPFAEHMEGNIVRIDTVELLDAEGHQKEIFSYDEPFTVRVGFDALEKIEKPSFGVEIAREDGLICCMLRSSSDGFTVPHIRGKGFFEMTVNGLRFAPLNYTTRVVIADSSVSVPIAIGLGPRFTVSSPIPYSNVGVVVPSASWKAHSE